jgi:sugar phosphate isomerase/epimerase
MADMIGINCDPFGSIDFARRFGFEGVDLRLDRFASVFDDRDSITRFRDALAQSNLRPGYCTFLPGKISCDETEWSDGIKRAPALAKLARALGYARCASVILPGHDLLDFESNWESHLRRIRRAMDVLNEYGISLALEYVAPKTRRVPFKFPFIHNLRGLAELLDVSDRCSVGVLLDSFHWYCARETPADIEALPAHRIVVVHVNDAIPDRPIDEQVVGERLLPGEGGVIDLGAFFAAMRAIGYDGPVTCEPTHPMWASTDAASAAQRTASSLRRFIAAP